MTAARIDILLVEGHDGDAELSLESMDGAHLDGRIHLVHDGQAALDFLLRQGAYADRVSDPARRLVLLELDLPTLTRAICLARTVTSRSRGPSTSSAKS